MKRSPGPSWIDGLPPLIFETDDQVRAFETALLGGVLERKIEPHAARVAVEIVKVIRRDSESRNAEANLRDMVRSMAQALADADTATAEEAT